MNKKHVLAVVAVLSLSAIVTLFQNCSPVTFSNMDDVASNTRSPATGDPSNTDPGLPSEDPPGTDPGGALEKNEKFVFAPDRKADILLVIDNSTSMKTDSLKLADRLQGFIDDLRNLNVDWQMCILTTELYTEARNPGRGQALPWKYLNKTVFKRSDVTSRTVQAVNAIFRDTIDSLYPPPANAGDERGIAALSRNVDQRAGNGCYRSGSVVAPIIISDEDERSWGGIQANLAEEQAWRAEIGVSPANSALLALADEDKADKYIAKMRSLGFGNLIVNSIVVTNEACKQVQKTTPADDGNIYLAFIGSQYMSLSTKTGVTPKSICDSDYSEGLSDFATRIGGSSNKFTLLCVPQTGSLQVSSPGLSQPNDYLATLDGNTLTVTSAREQQFEISVQYRCE